MDKINRRGRPRGSNVLDARELAIDLVRSTSMPYKAIARRLGCSEASVRRWSRELSLRPRTKPEPADYAAKRDLFLAELNKNPGALKTELCRQLGFSLHEYHLACQWAREQSDATRKTDETF